MKWRESDNVVIVVFRPNAVSLSTCLSYFLLGCGIFPAGTKAVWLLGLKTF